MGFYIRKSLSFGPLRLNLSKSGLGVSAGVKGLRVGTGPRGNYIQAGMGGLYYRQTLGKHTRAKRDETSMQPPDSSTEERLALEEIESADANSMTDHSATALLAELNTKRKLIQFWPFSLVAFIPVLLISIAQTHWWWTVLDVALAGVLLACVWWDKQRKTTILFYDLQPPILPAFEGLHIAFENLSLSVGKWHVEAQASILDKKYHAGANSSVRKSVICITQKCLPYVKTNIPVMCLPAGKQQLYFFPDRILVCDGSGIGAVSYTSLKVSRNLTRFVESQGAPSDSQIVGQTWQYVNKDGSPDRRFRDNRQIPIVIYTELYFRAETGLNEAFLFSNQQAVNGFVAAMESFAQGLMSANAALDGASLGEIRTVSAEPDSLPMDTIGHAPSTAASSGPAPDQRFYYFGNGVQGPFTAIELERLVTEGVISTETQVCSVDDQTWISYHTFLARTK